MMPVDEFVRILRLASPEDHPFLNETQPDEKGALFVAFSAAVADLIEGARQTDAGLALAEGILGAARDMLGLTFEEAGE